MFSSFFRKRFGRKTATKATGTSISEIPYPFPYQITATPLYPRPSTSRGNLFGRLLPPKMKGFWHRLKNGKPKQTKTMKEYHGTGVASRPMIGAEGDSAPTIDIRVIKPGTWYGKSASLVLLELKHQAVPVIPRAAIDVRITSAEKTQNQQPIVVAAGPYSVTAEVQSKEQNRNVKGHGDLGGSAGPAHANAGLELAKGSTQHDTVRGTFVAQPAFKTADGPQGVRFSISPPPGSEHGIPPCLHLAFVYVSETSIEFEAKLHVKDTSRILTIERGIDMSLVWPKGQWLSFENFECSACQKDQKDECQEFTHANKEFWYTFINQLELGPDQLPDLKDKSWFGEFERQGGVESADGSV